MTQTFGLLWYLHSREVTEPIFMTMLFEYVPLMSYKNDCSSIVTMINIYYLCTSCKLLYFFKPVLFAQLEITYFWSTNPLWPPSFLLCTEYTLQKVCFNCRSKGMYASKIQTSATICWPIFVSQMPLKQLPMQWNNQSTRASSQFAPLSPIQQTALMKNASRNWSNGCPS